MAGAVLLALAVFTGATGGIARAAAPTNDNLANAVALTSALSGSVTGSVTDATKEANEANVWAGTSDCPADDPSVWYSWTAPSTAYVIFATVLPAVLDDSTLSIYTGSVMATLTFIAENDDRVAGDYSSRVGFRASAETTYLIRVGAACGTQWSFTLNWQEDNIAPVFTSPATAFAINKWTVQVTFRAFDDVGAITTCRVNSGAYGPCRLPWTIELPRGTHTLEVKATDLAGNASTSSTTVTIVPGRIRVVAWPPAV